MQDACLQRHNVCQPSDPDPARVSQNLEAIHKGGHPDTTPRPPTLVGFLLPVSGQCRSTPGQRPPRVSSSRDGVRAHARLKPLQIRPEDFDSGFKRLIFRHSEGPSQASWHAGHSERNDHEGKVERGLSSGNHLDEILKNGKTFRITFVKIPGLTCHALDSS